MKPFNSSVLSIKEASSKQLLETVQERKSPLVRLLEFDESIAQTDLESTKAYYMSLLKLAQNPNPKTSDAVCDAIFNQYNAVIAALDGLYYADSYYIEDFYSKINNFENAVSKKIGPIDGMVQLYGINIKPRQISCNMSTLEFPITDYCKKVLKAVEEKDMSSIRDYDYLEKDVYNHIGKIFCNTNEVEDFDDLLHAFVEQFDITPGEVYTKTALQTVRSVADSINSNRIDCYNIGSIPAVRSLIETLKINSDIFEDPNDLRRIVQNICNASIAYGLAYFRLNEVRKNIMKKVLDFNISSIMHAIEENNDSFTESLSMFGDEGINSSNIFDLLDGEDFNNSYYMDLSLIADHEAAIDKIRIQKECLIQEAMMITEGNIDQAVIEAGIGSKIRDGFKKIIEFLRNMIEKFMESIRFNFGKEKEWLQKYRNVILNHSFDPSTKVTFYCNYKNAINLIKNVTPPAISYAQLKQKPQAFENEEAFLNEYFKSLATAMEQDDICKEKSDDTLANRVKWCLGAKWPDGKSKEVDFGTLEISEMYNWLLSTMELAKATENQVKTIEQTVANYDRQASALGVKNDNTQSQATKESSIFGIAVGTLITEADVTPGANSGDGDTKQTPAAGGKVNPVNQNNPDGKDQKQSSGQAKEEIQQSGDDPSLVAGRMQIYLNVCKAVLSAKATAITYAHKEMLDVMRAIVKAKLGNSADIQLRNQNPEGKSSSQPKNKSNDQPGDKSSNQNSKNN